MSNIVEVTNDNFNSEVIEADVPVLVRFTANWCGPCRQVAPLVEQLSDEYDNVKFVKVDVDQSPELSSAYKVSGIPAMKFFSGGVEVSSIVGAKPKSAIKEEIDRVLSLV